jgi:hypothetical protein
MLFLVFIHIADNIRRVELSRALKALGDSIERARSRHDKLIFSEVRELAVVQVGDILIRKKRTDERNGPQQCKSVRHTLRVPQARWKALSDDVFKHT